MPQTTLPYDRPTDPAKRHSAALTEHTAAVAQFCFEERWLRHRQKIEKIEPRREFARSLVRRVRARTSNSVYWGAFGTSFVLCVPFAWIGSWFPTRNPVFRGLANGQQDGSADAQRLVAELTGSNEPSTRERIAIEAASA